MSTEQFVSDLKSRFIWDEMIRMGVDATTPGERELSAWPLYAELISGEGIPVVSSNLTIEKDGTPVPLGHRTLVLERDGVRVGLFGLISGRNFTGSRLPEDVEMEFEDPLDVATKVVPELRAQSDLVVFLSQLSEFETTQLLESVPGIDVALLGDRSVYYEEERTVGDAILNGSGSRGQQLGSLLLVLGENGELVDWGSQNAQLDRSWPGDPATQARVDSLEAVCAAVRVEMREAEEEAAEAEEAGAAGSDRFLGAETCARCHSSEYQQWSQTPHAHAFATLQTDHGMELTDDCISCHVTGYDQPNGYVAEASAPDLRNVQCESCHGVGTQHVRTGGASKMSEAVCTRCHTGEFGKDFDFATAYELVKHTP